MDKPLIVGLGGTTRAKSSASDALRIALAAAEAAGTETIAFDGPFLASLPHYAPEDPTRTPEQTRLVDALRCCAGMIVATPAYHGGISGLVKNAIDLTEDMRADERVYLDGRAVGIITTAFGWQGGGSVMASMRSIVHALRGWPTPFGAMLNTAGGLFDAAGACTDEAVAAQLRVVGVQVAEFALMRQALARLSA